MNDPKRELNLKMAELAHRNRGHWGAAMSWRYLLRWATGQWSLR